MDHGPLGDLDDDLQAIACLLQDRDEVLGPSRLQPSRFCVDEQRDPPGQGPPQGSAHGRGLAFDVQPLLDAEFTGIGEQSGRGLQFVAHRAPGQRLESDGLTGHQVDDRLVHRLHRRQVMRRSGRGDTGHALLSDRHQPQSVRGVLDLSRSSSARCPNDSAEGFLRYWRASMP